MKRALSLALAATLSSTAFAADDINLGGLFGIAPDTAQSDFRTIVEDMGAAFNAKALNPAEPLGLIGFDVSVNATYAPVSDEDAWKRATGEDIKQIGSIGAKISKGLPAGLDASAFYNIVPTTSASFIGGTLSYSLEEGSIISPALGLRFGYTRGQGLDDFDFETKSVDLAISKGFAVLTPYASIGKVNVVATPTSAEAKAVLDEEDFTETRIAAGVKINVGFQLVVEAEKMAEVESISARVGFGF